LSGHEENKTVAAIPFVQDWRHRPLVLHPLLYPVLCPDATPYQRCSKSALACLLDMLQKRYPNAKIYSLLNSELREPINESMREICKHYNVQLIELHDIEKQNGHPSVKGMKSICEQLLEAGL